MSSRKKQSEILDDFKKNEEGKYEYVGKLHTYTSLIPRKRAYRNLGFLTVLILGFAILAGCVHADGATHELTIVFPYILVLLLSGFLTYRYIELVLGKDPLRDYIYESTVTKFPMYLWGIVICSIVTVIAEAIYILRFGIQHYFNGTMIFIGCMVLSGMLAYIWLLYLKRLSWEETNS